MSEKKQTRRKKGKGSGNMAVLTAECDRAFVVSADKAELFKKQKKEEKVFLKIDAVTAKLEKNLKVDKTGTR